MKNLNDEKLGNRYRKKIYLKLIRTDIDPKDKTIRTIIGVFADALKNQYQTLSQIYMGIN